MELYVKINNIWEQLDCEDSNISLTKQFKDFQDISAIVTDRSLTLQLPKTKHNNMVLGNYDSNSTDNFNDKYECIVQNNDTVLLEGELLISNVNRYYNVTIRGIKNKLLYRLKQLAFNDIYGEGNYTIPLNKETIAQGFLNTTPKDIVVTTYYSNIGESPQSEEGLNPFGGGFTNYIPDTVKSIKLYFTAPKSDAQLVDRNYFTLIDDDDNYLQIDYVKNQNGSYLNIINIYYDGYGGSSKVINQIPVTIGVDCIIEFIRTSQGFSVIKYYEKNVQVGVDLSIHPIEYNIFNIGYYAIIQGIKLFDNSGNTLSKLINYSDTSMGYYINDTINTIVPSSIISDLTRMTNDPVGWCATYSGLYPDFNSMKNQSVYKIKEGLYKGYEGIEQWTYNEFRGYYQQPYLWCKSLINSISKYTQITDDLPSIILDNSFFNDNNPYYNNMVIMGTTFKDWGDRNESLKNTPEFRFRIEQDPDLPNGKFIGYNKNKGTTPQFAAQEGAILKLSPLEESNYFYIEGNQTIVEKDQYKGTRSLVSVDPSLLDLHLIITKAGIHRYISSNSEEYLDLGNNAYTITIIDLNNSYNYYRVGYYSTEVGLNKLPLCHGTVEVNSNNPEIKITYRSNSNTGNLYTEYGVHVSHNNQVTLYMNDNSKLVIMVAAYGNIGFVTNYNVTEGLAFGKSEWYLNKSSDGFDTWGFVGSIIAKDFPYEPFIVRPDLTLYHRIDFSDNSSLNLDVNGAIGLYPLSSIRSSGSITIDDIFNNTFAADFMFRYMKTFNLYLKPKFNQQTNQLEYILTPKFLDDFNPDTDIIDLKIDEDSVDLIPYVNNSKYYEFGYKDNELLYNNITKLNEGVNYGDELNTNTFESNLNTYKILDSDNNVNNITAILKHPRYINKEGSRITNVYGPSAPVACNSKHERQSISNSLMFVNELQPIPKRGESEGKWKYYISNDTEFMNYSNEFFWIGRGDSAEEYATQSDPYLSQFRFDIPNDVTDEMKEQLNNNFDDENNFPNVSSWTKKNGKQYSTLFVTPRYVYTKEFDPNPDIANITIKSFWQGVLKEMFDNKNCIIHCKAYIDDIMFANYDQSKLVRYNDGLYILNKIENYAGPGMTDVELVQVQNINNYKSQVNFD